MNNLFVRAISGTVYVAIVLICCFSGASGQLFLACMLGAAAILEWLQFTPETRSARAASLSIGILFLLNYSYSGVFDLTEPTKRNFTFLIIFLFTTLLFSQVFTNKAKVPENLFHSIFGLIYIGFPMFLLPLVANFNGENEPWILASVFVLIWTSDTFAYLTGRQFGKRKLYERISPNKTIEGFIGGALFTFLAAGLLFYFTDSLSLIGFLSMAVIVVLFGTLGDLFESALKRSFNLKDSGNFMPGHGGILDRIDSLILTIPTVYFYLRVLENV
jgi:phosphatidate cytidylyltransferase